MIDREKVIKGLEYCITHYNCKDEVSTCPYIDLCEQLDDSTGGTLERDALALLKEQEPVEPKRTINSNGFHYDYCGACDCILPVGRDFNRANYCPRCGRPVKWE